MADNTYKWVAFESMSGEDIYRRLINASDRLALVQEAIEDKDPYDLLSGIKVVTDDVRGDLAELFQDIVMNGNKAPQLEA